MQMVGAVESTRDSGASLFSSFHIPPRSSLMVDYNLINSLGDIDSQANTAVLDALGDAANDLNKLVKADDVQDLVPNAILKGRIAGVSGDDFIVEMGLKS